MGESRRIEIDTHSIVLEAPDLLIVRFRGLLLEDHVVRYVAQRPSLLGDQKYILLMCDLRELTEVSLKGRRAIADIHDGRPQATGLVGGSFRLRVMAEMINTASRVFGKRQSRMRPFDDEASARAWLREMGQSYGALRYGL